MPEKCPCGCNYPDHWKENAREPVPANPSSSGVSNAPELTDITLDLYSACTFVKSFLTKLEDGSAPGDPLREIRRKFHAPLHAVLDAAISKARQSQPVPANPPSSGVSDAPNTRWQGFSLQEIYTIRGALSDSGGMRSDHAWYLRCSALHVELTTALAKARGEKPNAE